MSGQPAKQIMGRSQLQVVGPCRELERRHVAPNAAQSAEYQRSMSAMNSIASEIAAKQD